jgi:predicted chitinase
MPDVLKEGLHEYIDRLQEKLNDIGQTIYETFVRYSDAAPADSEIASPTPVLAHGAFHTFAGADLQMQQQQQ